MICLVRLIVAAVCGLLIGVERQTRMKGAGSVDVSRVAASIAAGIGFLGAGVIFVHRGGVVGLTDGKGDLVRLYDWLEQRKITVREIDLKRQEGSSVKIVLYIAMPRHFDKADFLRLQEDIPGVQSVEI